MKINYVRNNGPIDEMIEQLIDAAGNIPRRDYIREMIITSLKAGQEDEESANLKLMNTTLKEMRFTSKVFKPYRRVRKVTVFGSARVQPGDPLYEMARLFGRRLAEGGYMAITGGGGGIMQAINEGAGSDLSFGVNIRLPFEQRTNPVIDGDPKSIMYKYFFNRKVAFLKESDAVALFPGGFGTLDEAMETLTLVQTGKRNPLPLLFVDHPDCSYWIRLVEFFQKELLARNYISPFDFSLFERVSSADDAVARINRFYRRYHSMRYIRNQLVIRLLSQISSGEVRDLQESFRDVLEPGGRIERSGALEVERKEGDVIELPRLVIDFNRRNFGGLKRLIDAINDIP